jgi:two-component system chemotaxis response regulator CheB
VASTGGPLALQHVIAQLGDVPAPIVVVQHLHADFSGGFVRWLEQTTHVPAHLLEGTTVPRDGEVYVAPGGRHVRLADDGRLILSQLPELLHRPSGNELLHSLATCAGANAVAAVLTGMGDDGAAGLQAIAAAGGACFAQDPESCAVFGMPHAAVEAGAVLTTTRLASIGPAILRATRQRRLAGAAGTVA